MIEMVSDLQITSSLTRTALFIIIQSQPNRSLALNALQFLNFALSPAMDDVVKSAKLAT